MLTKKFLFSFLSSLYLNFQNYFFILLLGRIWGISVVGTITFVVSYVSLFSFLIDLQFSIVHTVKMSGEQSDGKNLGSYILIKLILAFFWIFCIILFTIINQAQFSTQTLLLIFILIIANLADLLAQMFIVNFRAKLFIYRAELPIIIGITVGSIARILVILLTRDIILLAFCYVLISVVQLLTTLSTFRGFQIEFPDTRHLKSYFQITFPLMISGSLSIFLLYFDKALIGLFYTESTLGKYYTLQSTANFIDLFSRSLGFIILPIFANYYINNQNIEIKGLIYRIERLVSVFLLPLVLTGSIIGTQFLEVLFLTDFGNLAIMFSIFLLIQLLASLNRPYVFSIVGTNRTSIVAIINSISSIVQIIVLMFFVRYGVVTIALTLLITTIFETFIWRVVCKYMFDIGINSKVFFHFLFGIPIFFLVYLVNLILRYHNQGNILFTTFTSALGFFIYLLAMIYIKEIGYDEYVLLRNVFKDIHDSIRNSFIRN